MLIKTKYIYNEPRENREFSTNSWLQIREIWAICNRLKDKTL
jgi:hypothetical protein